MQLHEPAVDHDAVQPWHIHCETARTFGEYTEDVPGAARSDWVFARDENGEPYIFEGGLVDGFFEVSGVRTAVGESVPPSRLVIRELCRETVERLEGDDDYLLGWVMAARAGEQVDIPPVYPDELVDRGVTRVVIFGDSLTDTGRLKRRLKVFPAKPYWLGRFSNGPAWPEYLAMATGLGVQNHAYGGASAADNEVLPGSNLYARIRDSGQFFVSGTMALQIEDYVERTLYDGRIERADTTAFLVWAGANDYISKEPVTGLITTFLNSPEGESGYKGVVESAVAATAEYLRTLHGAGARRFVVLNLPDLGHTPIVLQNTTYTPDFAVNNDTARRLELAHRLTRLTQYHNELLERELAALRMELAGAELLLVDTHAFFLELNGRDPGATFRPSDYGYDRAALAQTLQFGDDRLSLQDRCYKGAYVGTPGPKHVCQAPERALFWDTVHPSTLTHCWQAWHVGATMAAAGWIRPLPEPPDFLGWCRGIVGEVTAIPGDG